MAFGPELENMPRRKVINQDDMEDGSESNRWHVTRGIPLAFIITMVLFTLGQTGTAAWFASAMNYRVEAIEKAQLQMSPQGERLTRVEEKLEGVKAGITDIKALLTAQDTRSQRR
jgi:hypothetical protein